MPNVCLTSAPVLHSEELDRYLTKIAKGDWKALADLYGQTASAVYGFSLSMLKNHSDAEAALHDCFVNVYSAARSYHFQGKPMAWIMTVARNLCLLKLRERNRMTDRPPVEQETAFCQPEDKILLNHCMERLSDEERQIVVLHATAGFKHREIAKFLALPLATVLSKYARALKKIKKELSKGAVL